MKLNTFKLKIIATVLMVVDHVAIAFLLPSAPAYLIMRSIGRISAPLFWFCFAKGFQHTSNRLKFLLRLSIAAIITAIGNILVEHVVLGRPMPSAFDNNLFASFAIVGLGIYFIEQSKVSHKILNIAIATLILFTGGYYISYGPLIILSICTFYFIKSNILVTLIFAVGGATICLLQNNPLQVFMVLAILLINQYDDAKPKRSGKWFFYVFYPTHYWLLLLTAQLFKG